jgi:hypothetical protein
MSLLFRYFCAVAILTAVLAGAAPAVMASSLTVMVGNPKNPRALPQAIQAAYLGGARMIKIHPGTYLLMAVGKTTFDLQGWQDAVLSAYHVTFVMTDLKNDCFDLRQCSHVILEGPTITQNAVTFYQGRVISVGQGTDGKFSCVWKPDAGYPQPAAGADLGQFFGTINVVDGRTRHLRVGIGDTGASTIDALPDGTYRMHFNAAAMDIKAGDWLVGRYGPAPYKVHVINSRNCTIKEITLMRNGFAPLREEGGGGNRYLHDIWTLGPRPAGATADPVVTNQADGMHMTNASPGPDIEHCIMTGVFLDDCIAIHGYFQDLVSVAGNTVTVQGGAGEMVVGQPVRISDPHGFYAQATVTALKDNGNNTTTATLDQTLPIPVDSKLSNPLQDGAGYKIIDCQLGDTRSRGILAKADHGLIKGNTIIGCGMSAVSLGPEYYWGEADYVHHVLVEDNLIEDNGGATYGGTAVFIHGHGAVGNQDISVLDNRFVSNYQGDLSLQWTDGATIVGNHFVGANPWPAGLATPALMYFSNCTGVRLKGNTMAHGSDYKMPLITLGPDVTDFPNKNAVGLRAIDPPAANP